MLGRFRNTPSRPAHLSTGRVRTSLAAAMLAVSLMLVLSGTAAEARCSQHVYLYSASWCPSCRQVRAILARNNILYTLLDATTPRVQADMIARFGDTAIPRTLIGRSVVKGVDETRIKKLCAKGLRRQPLSQNAIPAVWGYDPWFRSLWNVRRGNLVVGFFDSLASCAKVSRGSVTLSAFSRRECSGQVLHVVADAAAQVRNEAARSSLKCGRRSR